MSNPLYILHALSEQTDADSLVKPISAGFPTIIQDLSYGGDLLAALREKSYSILFLDDEFPASATAPRLAQKINQQFPDLVIVLLTDDHHSSYLHPLYNKAAIFCLKKPIDSREVSFCVNHCQTLLDHRHNHDVNITRRARPAVSGFIGKSRVMTELFEIIERVADDDYATVLIRGESGTGKELVANAIHAQSSRRKHNFVPVNCAAIPDELLESELFGHMKGSFTGAAQNKTGRIQYADNGTLFLDEIGDMKPTLQAKLLRVIQEREFEPVGSLKAKPVNTRIVAATHCDLEKLVSEGLFREDLYYRLSVIPLEVPPLRRRSRDIPLLLEEFIDRHTTRRGREKIVFPAETIDLLKDHQWRGNVRELENLVQHMSILHSGERIYPHHLPAQFSVPPADAPSDAHAGTNPQPGITPDPGDSEYDISSERAALFASPAPPAPTISFDNGPINFNELINDFEIELIIKAMQFTVGNKKEASRMLGLKRTTLLEKIKKKRIEGRWELDS